MNLRTLWHYAAPMMAAAWRRLPSPFQHLVFRVIAPSYLVSVHAVCVNEANQILLLEQRFQRAEHKWGLPGGLMARGETPKECLRREAHEEAGLELHEITPIAVESDGPFVGVTYLCRVKTSQILLRGEEATGWCWFDLHATYDLPMRQAVRDSLDAAAQYMTQSIPQP